ncbi:MAG: DnaJ domain-containing protein [Ilumatobacteraceae bacterium]
MTHYERLGVDVGASPAEVRAAYRRAALASHPDSHSDSHTDGHPDGHHERSTAQMAEVNRAWWVLRDPQRRREYDLSLSIPTGPAAPTASRVTPEARRVEPMYNPFAQYQDPPRFPWRFMAFLASVGIAIVLIGVIITKPQAPRPLDNLLRPGSCVSIQPNGDAAEVVCDDPHDAVVVELVSFGERCPTDTEEHRDRQGLGIACVRR